MVRPFNVTEVAQAPRYDLIGPLRTFFADHLITVKGSP